MGIAQYVVRDRDLCESLVAAEPSIIYFVGWTALSCRYGNRC